MAMAGGVKLTPISVRVNAETRERIDRAAEAAGQSRSEWLLDAVLVALAITDDANQPKVVADAYPQRVGARMRMPPGRTYDGRF
jgi:uncharacterized protein (DUF1778 family)